ncbi:hypothetical protein JYU34_005920, partial [Plutella xylostella]
KRHCRTRNYNKRLRIFAGKTYSNFEFKKVNSQFLSALFLVNQSTVKMRSSVSSAAMFAAVALALLLSVTAIPMESEDEQSENSLAHGGGGADADEDLFWRSVDVAALRKLLLKLDGDERFNNIGGRVSRAWPQPEPRGYSGRGPRAEGRVARSWTDKRQVRFRQCYFNPISCFRK